MRLQWQRSLGSLEGPAGALDEGSIGLGMCVPILSKSEKSQSALGRVLRHRILVSDDSSSVNLLMAVTMKNRRRVPSERSVI